MLKFANLIKLTSKPALAFAVASAFVMPGQLQAEQDRISNDLSKCQKGTNAPMVLVNVSGFEGNSGRVRVQSYRANKNEWLKKGKWINRIDVPVRVRNGSMQFCVPLPSAGSYGIAVRHDKNSNGKTDISSDGGGFSNNPSLNIFNLGKPSYKKTAFSVGKGLTTINIQLKYM